MSRKYKIRDQNKLYFVTFTVIQWLDVFTRQEYRDIFLDSVRYCQENKGLEVCAYVVMSNHIHMIIGRHSDYNQPIELGTDENVYKILDYIHENPVKAGIVCSPENYLYSSAMNYANMPEQLLDVILI